MSKQFPGITVVKGKKMSGNCYIYLKGTNTLIHIKNKELNSLGHLDGHETGKYFFQTILDPQYQHGFKTLKEAKKKAEEILKHYWVTEKVYP